jgi:L-alanine-DL-glutamate epimerase-like enolase superfamily enzyme
MNRRYFLMTAVASTATRLKSATKTAKISRITLAPIEGRFHKFVAMNSYDRAPKGHTYNNTLVRISTDQDVEGVGVMGYAAPSDDFVKTVRKLIGTNPFDVYVFRDGRITGRSPEFEPLLGNHQHLDGPLYDLIGKLLSKPAWRLIGASVRDRIEVYDGTLYFSDIWFRDRGIKAVLEETEEALKSGYKGLKYKLGRGWKWMEQEEGLKRDIELMKAVRKEFGPEVKILADANNGFQKYFEGAWRLLAETQDVNLYWMEELFPEDVAQYTELHSRMERAGIKTLIADGESVRSPEQFAAYLKPRRLMDVLQMDIRRGGFLDNRRMAEMGEEAGAVSVPHNWGSQAGLFMGLHLAKAVKSVTAAEDDRSTCDVLHAEGYQFRGGSYTVGDAAGLGLTVDQKVYVEKYKAAEMVVA